MLTERQEQILIKIVEEYVRTAEPVGSKVLATLPEFGLSSATIRNEMAVLEEMGLIVKTHTSSGRIPSEEGYRRYVKLILQERQKAKDVEKIFPLIDEIFTRDMVSREQAVKESMALVTELTNYASVVLGGSSYNSRIKKLQFVQLQDRFAVILMVTDQGYVESKKIIIPEDINISEIEKVINLLNELLYDCPISEIDNTIKEKLSESDIRSRIDYYDQLISIFVRAFTEMAKDKYYLSGQSKIIKQPEFQDLDKIEALVSAIERQEIFKVVNLNEHGITVKIGRENQIKAMEDCTVISVPFENELGERGAIAVIGPTRMDYRNVIPLLEYISKALRKM
ncbi:MAG TPA: heat-inducible transcriptional repressor HrcA [Bacilli bacterium]